MARNDDSQRSKVYKASDVHKRRINRKQRADGVSQDAAPNESHEAATRTADDNQGLEGVVLTPEFGHRTDEQKKADDRWFAAMRDVLPEVVPAIGDAPASDDEHRAETVDSFPAETATAPSTDLPGPSDVASQQEALKNPREPSEASTAPAPSAVQITGDESTRHGESAQRGEAGPGASRESSAPKTRSSVAGAVKGMSVRRRVLTVLAIALVAVVAVAVALFTWNRWYRFDDHADMQGQWYVVGTTVPVTIDGSAIKLTDDVVYQYEINVQDKTMRYTFGPMEGQGRYWFSDDRQYLVITDGDEFTSAGTAFDDLMHMFADLPDKVSGANVKLPEGEGIIAFSREPDVEALAREREEAARKAAEEAAARKEAERIAAEQAAAEDQETYYYEEEYYEDAPAENAPAEDAPDEDAPDEDAPAEQTPAGEAPAGGE